MIDMPNKGQNRKGEAGYGDAGTNPAKYCLKIGLAAGVIWGLARWLAVAMNLTKVPEAFLIDPWVKRSVLAYPIWQIVGFAAFVLMSIMAAYIYYGILKPLRGPLPGIFFGMAWWAAFYAALGPFIGAMPPLMALGWDSLITDLCLFTVWGLFIGFSIAFEFHEEVSREPEPSPA